MKGQIKLKVKKNRRKIGSYSKETERRKKTI